MIKGEVLGHLVDSKKSAVLKVVLNSSDELCLKEISHRSSVPMASTFRILQGLVKAEMVQRRVWKNSKVYSCLHNEKVDFARELFHEEFDGLGEFVQAVQDLSSIQNILLHGVQKKGKANVLLIGEKIDTPRIEEACQKLREKGFELSYLTLTKEQYAQMVKMGLYSGEKKVLK